MKATITLKDEVNCKVEGLDLNTRRKLQNQFSFMLPYAYHVPAFKLGRWDGKINFFSVGGATYVNLLEQILPTLIEAGYEIDLVDKRIDFGTFSFPEITETHFSNKVWPEKHPIAGEPVVLRDYQVEIINQFCKNPQCLQEISTGAGKTLITAGLSNIVEEYGRSIVIVPNKDLVIQTEVDYKNLGLDVGVYFGDRKELGKTHTICTWQSLNVIEKNFKDGKTDWSLVDFAEDVVCVIVDEVHQAKGEVLKKLLTGSFKNIPIRWGLTGTIPKADHDRMTLGISLGELVNQLSAATLQDAGVLANCHVNVVQLQETVAYDNYQSELTYLTTDTKRLDYMADMIADLGKKGNTLVLIDRIKAGEGLLERLPEDTVFIRGAMKSKDRKQEYDDVSEADNKIIVATYGVAAVGINIPRIFNLVLVEPGKSFVRVIQSIGRGIRKAKDKDSVEIWDLTSSAKFSKKHLTQRKKFYKEAQYPYTIKKVDYR
jgi:superfamily II DNA or RNA helicase